MTVQPGQLMLFVCFCMIIDLCDCVLKKKVANTVKQREKKKTVKSVKSRRKWQKKIEQQCFRQQKGDNN